MYNSTKIIMPDFEDISMFSSFGIAILTLIACGIILGFYDEIENYETWLGSTLAAGALLFAVAYCGPSIVGLFKSKGDDKGEESGLKEAWGESPVILGELKS